MAYIIRMQAHIKSRVLLFYWMICVIRLNNNYLAYGKKQQNQVIIMNTS